MKYIEIILQRKSIHTSQIEEEGLFLLELSTVLPVYPLISLSKDATRDAILSRRAELDIQIPSN